MNIPNIYYINGYPNIRIVETKTGPNTSWFQAERREKIFFGLLGHSWTAFTSYESRIENVKSAVKEHLKGLSDPTIHTIEL